MAQTAILDDVSSCAGRVTVTAGRPDNLQNVTALQSLDKAIPVLIGDPMGQTAESRHAELDDLALVTSHSTSAGDARICRRADIEQAARFGYLLAEAAEHAVIAGSLREVFPVHIRDVEVVLDSPQL
jgi:hypothetical protein